MTWLGLRVFGALACAAVTTLAATAAGPAAGTSVVCPPTNGGNRISFPDGVTLIKTGLNVNPDGAIASYTPGDHGYTYIANGVNLWESGHEVICSDAGNVRRCNREWADAERENFASGTAEFCVFAMDVEPITSGAKVTSCRGGSPIAGNGKGRPVVGANFPSVSGGQVPTYLSTTSIMHTINGKAVYVDSAAVPGIVSPNRNLLGSVVWVNYPKEKHATFAVVNDSGPSFGEGTVALHRILHRGDLGPRQPVGPIPVADRCSSLEPQGSTDAPFVSRPDLGSADQCRPGFKPRGAADIRAYGSIDSGVQIILLPGIKFSLRGNVVQEEITVGRMKELAEKAGYTEDKLSQIAKCAAN